MSEEKNDKATIVVHSGDFDKIYSAFIIGSGALSMGMDVSMYFTFWGLERLKEGELESGGLSKRNMLGLGKWIIKRKMKEANVSPLENLLKDYLELGGKILACDMTMDVMGVEKDEMRDEVITDYCTVGTFIKEAKESEFSLFI